MRLQLLHTLVVCTAGCHAEKYAWFCYSFIPKLLLRSGNHQ